MLRAKQRIGECCNAPSCRVRNSESKESVQQSHTVSKYHTGSEAIKNRGCQLLVRLLGQSNRHSRPEGICLSCEHASRRHMEERVAAGECIGEQNKRRPLNSQCPEECMNLDRPYLSGKDAVTPAEAPLMLLVMDHNAQESSERRTRKDQAGSILSRGFST
jgi:hypothetical protein